MLQHQFNMDVLAAAALVEPWNSSVTLLEAENIKMEIGVALEDPDETLFAIRLQSSCSIHFITLSGEYVRVADIFAPTRRFLLHRRYTTETDRSFLYFGGLSLMSMVLSEMAEVQYD